VELARCPPKAAQEFIQPAPGVRLGQRQAQKKTSRRATHGSHIAHGTRQAFPPHRVRRMLSAKEVRPLQKPVAGQDGFVSSLRAEYCCVITNTYSNAAAYKVLRRVRCTRKDTFQYGILVRTALRHQPFPALPCTFVRQYNSLAKLGCSQLQI
jgi:hypothetical protein